LQAGRKVGEVAARVEVEVWGVRDDNAGGAGAAELWWLSISG
jgi:hypothetical protein